MTVTSINGVLYVHTKEGFKTYEWKDLEGKTIHQPKVSVADHSFVLDVLKRTTARVLTLIEASISDPVQRQAQKNVIKDIFSDEMEKVTDALYSQEMIKEWTDIANEQAEKMTEKELADSAIDVEEIIFDRI